MLLRPLGGAAPQPIHGAAPRILQLLPDAPPKTVIDTAIKLAEGLNNQGSLSVIAGGGNTCETLLRRNGVDHRPFTGARDTLFQHSATQALLDTVHHRNIDLVHVHGTQAGLAAQAFANAANLPLVMSCDTVPSASGFLGRRSARKVLTGRPMIVPSAHVSLCLQRDFGVPETSIRVIPPGIDGDKFDEGSVTSARTVALVRDWGLDDDPRPIILVPEATADGPWLDWILTVAANADTPDALWLLSGDASLTEGMVARINRSPALGQVRWVGPCTDWPAAYKLASLVMALPVRPPAFSMHALQAQAMGRPVVASDLGGNVEAIQPGKTGWLVRHRDIGSLVYAVSAAIDREDVIRDAMSLAARSLIRSRYGQLRMQQEIFALYHQVLREYATG